MKLNKTHAKWQKELQKKCLAKDTNGLTNDVVRLTGKIRDLEAELRAEKNLRDHMCKLCKEGFYVPKED